MSLPVLAGVHQVGDPAETRRRLGGNATRPFTAVVTPGADEQDLVKKMTAVCRASWAAGQVAVWSFKPDPVAVSTGRFKAQVQAVAVYLKANPQHRTLVIIWHEPENDVPQWFPDAAAFVRLWETVAGWLRAVWPDIVLGHAALLYRYAGKVDITDAVAKRWRTTATVHLADGYSGRTFPLGMTLPEHSGYVRWRANVAQDDDWGMAERGWTITDNGDAAPALRAATMVRELAWLLTDRPRVYMVWGTSGKEKDKGLILDAELGEPAAAAIVGTLLALDTAETAAAAAAARTIGCTLCARTGACPMCAGAGQYTITV